MYWYIVGYPISAGIPCTILDSELTQLTPSHDCEQTENSVCPNLSQITRLFQGKKRAISLGLGQPKTII
jgi:hypothetical protein